MADVNAGLEVGGAEAADPFEAALESKGVKGGGSSAILSVADGLTFGDRKPEPVEKTDTSDDGTTEEEADSPLHEDPDIAAYLKKFDGDADKALAAAVEAQKVIGRQGNELGELKSTVDQLTGRLDEVSSKIQATAPAATWATWNRDQIEANIAENNPAEVVAHAVNSGAPDNQVLAILKVWAEDDPIQAAEVRDEWRTWQTAQKAAATAITAPAGPSKTEQFVEQQIEAARMQSTMDGVAADFADFDSFKEYIPAALEASGKIVAKALLDEDDETQKDAVRLVFERAEKMATDNAAKDAIAAVKAKASLGKESAKVIRGSSGTPAAPNAGPEGAQTREDEVARFKASILGAETTSVADGLVVAK